jgi:predicted O-methyltransferase YrrM
MLQGRLLMQLVSMTRDGRVLELGTFTGYGTACFLEGAVNAGEAMGVSSRGNRDCGPFVMTLEQDARVIDIAGAHLKAMCEHISLQFFVRKKTAGTSVVSLFVCSHTYGC